MQQLIQHDLDMLTAKRVVDHAFEAYRLRFPEYQPSLRWADDRRAEASFNARGVKLQGSLLIGPKSITLDLDVPFFLRPFQKRALEVIEREVRAWLDKARAGEI
jgi:hypothetical protein